MAAHRMSFEVDGLWGLQDQTQVAKVYRQCRKTLPHVDTLLAERLKGQSVVETSLMQALFSEVKSIIRFEVVKVLKEIKEKVDAADIQIDDLNLDHFIDRIVMYIVCGGNLLMCGITIYLFLSVRRDIIGRIDIVM